VEYIASAAVSAKWAFPLGLSIIKPPQDMFFLTEREESKRCVDWCETEKALMRKKSRKKGREIRGFGDLGCHIAQLYLPTLT